MASIYLPRDPSLRFSPWWAEQLSTVQRCHSTPFVETRDVADQLVGVEPAIRPWRGPRRHDMRPRAVCCEEVGWIDQGDAFEHGGMLRPCGRRVEGTRRMVVEPSYLELQSSRFGSRQLQGRKE